MKFNIWKNNRMSVRPIVARNMDLAVDKFMEMYGNAFCDCISDHITLIGYRDGTVVIAEDGYTPVASDFEWKLK